MKTLIIKELRENFKIGLIGFAFFTLIVLGSGLSYSRFINAVASGTRSLLTNQNHLHPLTSSEFVMAVGWACATFGLLLGWLQVHNEKHRDLWAFLIHRPIPRTVVFWAKVLSGLSLYVTAAGLPLFLFLLWMSVPGHVAAPFEWAMASPIGASFLLGIAWYFAGMLTRIREARWYLTRALGIGAAIVATGAAVMSWHQWELTLVLIGCGSLLAIAVWGAFHSHGYYEPQPTFGKIALTSSITFGTIMVVGFAAVLILELFPGVRRQPPSMQYVMLTDGAVHKQIYHWGGTLQLQDLQGNVLNDVRGFDDLQARQAPSLRLIGDKQPDRSTPPFYFWDATPDTIWFYWTAYGRLFGFDLRTRQLIGTLGPMGFSPNDSRSGDRLDRFELPWAFTPGSSREDLHTDNAVYEVDTQKRTVRPVFTTPADDPILAAGSGGVARSGARALRLNTAVLTRRSLRLIGPDDQIIWRVPFEQPRKEYTDVMISILGTNGQFAVSVAPSYRAETKNPGKFPVYVTWFDREQDVLKKTELPPLSSANKDPVPGDNFIGAVMPPAVITLLFTVTKQSLRSQPPLISVTIALLIFVPLGAWVGRRYNFSSRAQIAWAIFHLFSGLPGFLAFIAVHDWPAREGCRNCNKLRAVNRDQCEHCRADFPPPTQDGTEIFEPVLLRQTTLK
jgi:hypothetical protein